MTSVPIPEKGMGLIAEKQQQRGRGAVPAGSASCSHEDGLGRAVGLGAAGAVVSPLPPLLEPTDRTTLGSGVLAIRGASSSAL